jgi:hypothetical protein
MIKGASNGSNTSFFEINPNKTERPENNQDVRKIEDKQTIQAKIINDKAILEPVKQVIGRTEDDA